MLQKRKSIRLFLILLGILLIILIIFLFCLKTSNKINGNSILSIFYVCNDTDNTVIRNLDLSYFVAGSVFYRSSFSKVTSNLKDSCQDNFYLLEAYCNKNNKPAIIKVKCDTSCQNGACSIGQSSSIRVGFVEDFSNVERSKEIDLTENLSRDKNLDLMIFHEDFFKAFSEQNDYIIINKINSNTYYFGESNNPNLSKDIKRIQTIAKTYKTNMIVVVPAKVNSESRAIVLSLINSTGDISYIYYKLDGYSLFNITTKRGYSIPSIAMICTGPPDYYSSNGKNNLNASLFIRSSWGQIEVFAMPIMEYYQTGNISDQTFNFLKNSQEHSFLMQHNNILTKEDMINRIKNKLLPFDWINDANIKLSQTGDLRNTGYFLMADQIGTNGALNLNGMKVKNIEYGQNFSYIITDIFV